MSWLRLSIYCFGLFCCDTDPSGGWARDASMTKNAVTGGGPLGVQTINTGRIHSTGWLWNVGAARNQRILI